MGSLLRDQLASVHVEMEVEQARFSTLLTRVKEGALDAWMVSWWMDWPTPDNFLQLLHLPKTDTFRSDAITGTNWRDTDAAESVNEAWEQVLANSEPTDEAQGARNEAYLEIEDANWKDVIMLPEPRTDCGTTGWMFPGSVVLAAIARSTTTPPLVSEGRTTFVSVIFVSTKNWARFERPLIAGFPARFVPNELHHDSLPRRKDT